MNIDKIIQKVSQSTGEPAGPLKDAWDAVLDCVTNTMFTKRRSVIIPNFCHFILQQRIDDSKRLSLDHVNWHPVFLLSRAFADTYGIAIPSGSESRAHSNALSSVLLNLSQISAECQQRSVQASRHGIEGMLKAIFRQIGHAITTSHQPVVLDMKICTVTFHGRSQPRAEWKPWFIGRIHEGQQFSLDNCTTADTSVPGLKLQSLRSHSKPAATARRPQTTAISSSTGDLPINAPPGVTLFQANCTCLSEREAAQIIAMTVGLPLDQVVIHRFTVASGGRQHFLPGQIEFYFRGSGNSTNGTDRCETPPQALSKLQNGPRQQLSNVRIHKARPNVPVPPRTAALTARRNTVPLPTSTPPNTNSISMPPIEATSGGGSRAIRPFPFDSTTSKKEDTDYYDDDAGGHADDEGGSSGVRRTTLNGNSHEQEKEKGLSFLNLETRSGRKFACAGELNKLFQGDPESQHGQANAKRVRQLFVSTPFYQDKARKRIYRRVRTRQYEQSWLQNVVTKRNNAASVRQADARLVQQDREELKALLERETRERLERRQRHQSLQADNVRLRRLQLSNEVSGLRGNDPFFTHEEVPPVPKDIAALDRQTAEKKAATKREALRDGVFVKMAEQDAINKEQEEINSRSIRRSEKLKMGQEYRQMIEYRRAKDQLELQNDRLMAAAETDFWQTGDRADSSTRQKAQEREIAEANAALVRRKFQKRQTEEALRRKEVSAEHAKCALWKTVYHDEKVAEKLKNRRHKDAVQRQAKYDNARKVKAFQDGQRWIDDALLQNESSEDEEEHEARQILSMSARNARSRSLRAS